MDDFEIDVINSGVLFGEYRRREFRTRIGRTMGQVQGRECLWTGEIEALNPVVLYGEYRRREPVQLNL